MKKYVCGSIAGTLLLMFSSAASADSIIHLWSCQANDDVAATEVEQWSVDWLKAAKAMEGGSDFKVYVEYPLVATAEAGTFTWVLVVPNATAWGMFEDVYDGSKAQEIDATFSDIASCSGSSLWESKEIK